MSLENTKLAARILAKFNRGGSLGADNLKQAHEIVREAWYHELPTKTRIIETDEQLKKTHRDLRRIQGETQERLVCVTAIDPEVLKKGARGDFGDDVVQSIGDWKSRTEI